MILEHMIQILTLWYLQHHSGTPIIQILTLWYLQHDSGTPMIQILTLWYLQHDSGTPNDSDTYTFVFTT